MTELWARKMPLSKVEPTHTVLLKKGELGSSCLSQILHAEQNLMEPKLWSKRPEPPLSSNPKLKPKTLLRRCFRK